MFLGVVQMVSLLLDYGAAIDAADSIAMTPLMAAAAQGHIEVIRRLLNAQQRDFARSVRHLF